MSKMNSSKNVAEHIKVLITYQHVLIFNTKYSTNKLAFFPCFWYYKFEKGYRILELGCGNGSQWEGRIDKLPEDCTLVLFRIFVSYG